MLHMHIRALASSLLFISLVACSATPLARGNEAVSVSNVHLLVAGREIPAELFQPASGETRTTVLLLHGAGGTLLDGPEMRRVARGLAADGNAVYLLHYFQQTHTLVALDSTMQRHFDVWLETVRGSVVAVQKARNSTSPVGIYGYSLGAFLALAAASDNPRVGAVVEHAGGIWNNRGGQIGHMPPVLVIHGERDARVPFARFVPPLLLVLRRNATTVKTHFFPDEAHVFTPAAMQVVRPEAAQFFREHLRPR